MFTTHMASTCLSRQAARHVRFASTATKEKYKVVVVGGGSGGLSVANQIYNRFLAANKPLNHGDIVVLDEAQFHYYQPGWTLVGAGLRPKQDFRRPLASLFPPHIAHIGENVATFSPTASSVTTSAGRSIIYETLVIAAGLKSDWDAITGLSQALTDPASSVSSIYSFDTCDKTWKNIDSLQYGNAIFTQPAGVIKCAGAPQKIMWMAWDRYRKSGRGNNINVAFMTGMPSMFGVKKYSDALDALRVERGIGGEFGHNLVAIDASNRKATFKKADGTTVDREYSLLHVTPPMGPLDFIKNSPVADAAGWVEVNPTTLQHVKPEFSNIFAVGDCSSLPTSKTAAAITSQAPVLTENLFSVMDSGSVSNARYNGYTSCPLLTGYGELMLAEFKYGLEPRETFSGFLGDQTQSRRLFYHLKRLLGVLTHHQIRYPTPYTKAKLVQLFLDEIKPKVAKLRKERLKRQNSLASDDGITDGLTGRPLNADTKATRRSSRRLSRAPEDDELLQRPEPPKRRRSSAQPDLGRIPSTKARANVPTLVEESEPEEEELPARKATRRKEVRLADDSGWDDNNIFQSGAESSSPTRPSPVRRATRKSAAHKKSRHSMSAPPHLSPPSSPIKAPPFPHSSHRSPPQSKFEPQLPLNIPRQPSVWSPPGKRMTFVPLSHQSSPSLAPEQLPQSRILDVDSGVADRDFDSAAPLVSIPEGGIEESELNEQVSSTSVIVNHHEPRAKSRPYLLTLLYAICFLVFSSIVIKYKRQSASIGFCDAGSNSSRSLQEFQAHISAIEPCVRANRTFMDISSELFDAITAKDGLPCRPLSLIPLPHPSACTPCPEYASCSQHTVTCNTGHLLRPHPILALLSPFRAAPSAPVELVWTFISEVADGLPGLGPVAFPPHCIEDPKRKRNIGALGKAIEALLGQERGRRVCAGGDEGQLTISDSEGGEARKWGLEVEVLRETMEKKTAPHLLDTFDDTFNEAMQQLVEWGSVVFGGDMSGHRYLAHKTANLTLNCKLTVKFREVWLRCRATVFVLFASTCMFYTLRRSRAQRQIENKRVAELVQIALDTLRNQELAHHTDPVTAPYPYLSSLQLRDLILQEQHSISVRKRLWDQVERVVEGNANVRVNLEEVQGGDEHRVWRWVGTAGRGPEYRNRVQTETEKGEGQVA
ncbi:hypothetical protein J3R83DRAFT_1986 [Lanmaoa asiatica]|nr:hypothetical protein J3R83DRAFT_1986 [Lanmaoa asiatica]